jgi:hypothetical protein
VLQPAANSNGYLDHFSLSEACQTATLVYSGLPHLTQQVKIQKKCAKQLLLSAAGCYTRLDF